MRRLVAQALAFSLVGPIALSAQKPKKEKEKSHATEVTVVFSVTQREAARSYFVEKHGPGNCPPGLAKSTTVACHRDRRRNATSSATHCRMGLLSRRSRWSCL